MNRYSSLLKEEIPTNRTPEIWANFLRDKAHGIIYFILARKSNKIKIGFTRNGARRRLSAAQTYSPENLELLLEVPGEQDEESEIHFRLRAFRSHGEWFDFTAEVQAFMSGLSS